MIGAVIALVSFVFKLAAAALLPELPVRKFMVAQEANGVPIF